MSISERMLSRSSGKLSRSPTRRNGKTTPPAPMIAILATVQNSLRAPANSTTLLRAGRAIVPATPLTRAPPTLDCLGGVIVSPGNLPPAREFNPEAASAGGGRARKGDGTGGNNRGWVRATHVEPVSPRRRDPLDGRRDSHRDRRGRLRGRPGQPHAQHDGRGECGPLCEARHAPGPRLPRCRILEGR